jgi:hypothetical protein
MQRKRSAIEIAHEAVAAMRRAPYPTARGDIRLLGRDGYATGKRLRDVQPNVLSSS